MRSAYDPVYHILLLKSSDNVKTLWVHTQVVELWRWISCNKVRSGAYKDTRSLTCFMPLASYAKMLAG